MKKLSCIMVSATALLLVSCDKIDPNPAPPGGRYDNVFIMCALGFNSLSYDISTNISELMGTVESTSVPMSGSSKALVVFEHTASDGSGYGVPTPPRIISIYKDFLGRPVCDTILTMEAGAKLTEKGILRKGLEYIKDRYPSDHYGILLSSHGTGWLPEGYYRDGRISSIQQTAPSSFGEETEQTEGKKKYFEMNVTDLRDAIPMHLDYLLFDACLMGGVEVAYELKDRTDAIGFSVTEILSGGFDYVNMVSRLLGEGGADPEGVCRDYFKKYEHSSATITFLKTASLDRLASLSKDIFSKYRQGMSLVNPDIIQHYHRYSSRPYFFDFKDILDKSGVSAEDMAPLESALNDCIAYKEATKYFLSVPVENFCGLSMYLPKAGNAELDEFYRTYAWNDTTGLVE